MEKKKKINYLKPKQVSTKLSPKQELFVSEYMKDGNGKRAAEAAGYKSAASVASQYLSGKVCPLVKAEIDRLLAEKRKEYKESLKKQDEILGYIQGVMYFEPLKFFEPSEDGGWLIEREKWSSLPSAIGCLIEEIRKTTRIKEFTDASGKKTKLVTEMFWVRLVSKTVAMSLAAKHQLPIPKQSLDVNISTPDWDRLHQVSSRSANGDIQEAEVIVTKISANDEVEKMIDEAVKVKQPIGDHLPVSSPASTNGKH